MAVSYCPGQNRRYWKPDDISFVECPACGMEVELFKDEGSRKCPGCGVRVQNPKVLEGCASWCSFAEDCIGFSGSSEDPARKLITIMKNRFQFSVENAVFLFSVYDATQIVRSSDIGAPQIFKIAAVAITCFFLLGKTASSVPEEIGKVLTDIIGKLDITIDDKTLEKVMQYGNELYTLSEENEEKLIDVVLEKAASAAEIPD